MEQVAAAAGVMEIINIADIPNDLLIRKPSALSRVLGAYLYRTQTAFVDLTQPTGRKRFILAHETGHRIVPWHADSHHLDDDTRLFHDAQEELEQEANLAATLLMFQGGRYHQRALDYETGMRTPIALAESYGASLHASIWFYAYHHPEAVAVVIAGRYPRADGTLPVWRSAQSRSFADRFGTVRDLLPSGGVPIREEFAHPLTTVARGAFNLADVTTDVVSLPDLDGNEVRCTVDSFFNQRCLFLMVSPKHAVRRGRRIAIRAG